jgi:maltose phosphorylase
MVENGYPEYFAKVLNAPNWIGIDIEMAKAWI